MAPRKPLRKLIFQGERAPRDFTTRRQRLATEFMEEWAANPNNYAKFGTSDWAKALVIHLNQGTRHPVSTLDVDFWIDTHPFFLKWEEQIGRQVQVRFATSTGLNCDRPNSEGETDEDVSATDENIGGNDEDVSTATDENIGRNELEDEPERMDFEEYIKILPTSASDSDGKIKTEVKQEPEPEDEGNEPKETLKLPEVRPRQPHSVPHMLRRLRDYTDIVGEKVNDLKRSGCAPRYMEQCNYSVQILKLFLAEVDGKMPELLVD